MSTLEVITKEINQEIAKEEVQRALLATTFKGLDALNMRKALMEGMMRGFKFKDFLEKNVYAIPFRDKKTGTSSYSLITSIDYARKIGMRSGVVGKSAPIYTDIVDESGKKYPETCTITIKRKVDGYVGEYTATVYFSEFNTGYQLWASKPRVMIAKVAEMHALRMACPEELSQAYIEEEMVAEIKEPAPIHDISAFKELLNTATTAEELKKIWSKFPGEVKHVLKEFKDELKKKYEDPKLSK